jgi:dihydrodipicolinate synthase/N-acetylneuraminate lyase
VRLEIKGLFLASPNGEGHLMTDSMRMDLAAEVVKSNQDRMILSMLVADNPAKLMIDNIKRIEDCGIDMAVISFPFTPVEIELEYLKELYFSVLEESSLPIALCHIGRVSSDPLEIDLFKEIITHQKVILVKDCSGNLVRRKTIIEVFLSREKELFALGSNEFDCMPYAEAGYDGFLLNSACFTGFLANTILEFFEADRIQDARAVQDYMNSMLVDIFGSKLECFLAGQKHMLVELGVFNTTKTLQNHQISEDCLMSIKEIVLQEKEFLLPEIE